MLMGKREREGERGLLNPFSPPKNSPREHSCISSTINRGIQITLLDRNPYIISLNPPLLSKGGVKDKYYNRLVSKESTHQTNLITDLWSLLQF
jgi:hypothetical protein